MKKIVLGLLVVFIVGSTKLNPLAADASVDELLNLILNDTPVVVPATNTGTTSTPAVTTTTTTTMTTTPAVGALPNSDIEFRSALSWMYTNGLTQFSTIDKFEPTNGLTRQQAAKFFVVMQETIIGAIPAVANTACGFVDTGFDPSLRAFVDKACAYGILLGKDKIFRPNAQISKPEFVTALVRMIEGAKRDETGTPRWTEYYQQAKTRGLTKEQNANAFDTPVTRYEAALFLYRSLAPIRQSGIVVTDNTAPPALDSAPPTTAEVISTPAGQPTTPSVSDPTLQEAVYRMNDNGMTKFSSVELYRPFDTLQRQEAAKIFTLFRGTIIQGTPLTESTSCAFNDLNISDQTLVSYIKQACQLQILKGSNNLFNPEGLLTKPQAIAILIRMIEGNQDESGAIRWQKYYDKAVAMGMIEPTQPENFDKPISRYEIAKILYNSKVKYALIKNLNNDYETNKLIYPVPDTQRTGANTGEIKGLVSINTQILSRTDIDSYIVDLFGNQYRLERQVTQKYLNNDYVWYGKLTSIDKTRDIGTTAFTISNGVIIDGVLRPYLEEQSNYFLSPSKQQPYYEMVKKLK